MDTMAEIYGLVRSRQAEDMHEFKEEVYSCID
jgi:hypothetical protein